MTNPEVAWISLLTLPAIYTSVRPIKNSNTMMNVIGQLTDQLREMKDLISSLLNNVSNLITSYLKDYKKLPHSIRKSIKESRGKIFLILFFIIIDPPSTFPSEASGLDQFNQKRCRPIFFTQFFMEGAHTVEKDIQSKSIGRC